MPIYKAKLKSIGDPSDVSLNNYYENNSPYTGYVILSKFLSDDYGLFNDNNITKEYLSRGDSSGLIGPACAVDLSKIYRQNIGSVGQNPVAKYLACAALGKDIGYDENYFYHYMDIDSSDNININEAGFPFADSSDGDNSENSIMTPYSDSAYSKVLYANFSVVGMSKAATPYITTGLFLEPNHTTGLTDKTASINYGDQYNDSNIYEFPGYSALSTRFAEILWYGAKDKWASSSAKDEIIHNTLNDSNYNSVDDITSKIASVIRAKLNVETELSSNYSNIYLANVSSVISNLVITNGSDFYEMTLKHTYVEDFNSQNDEAIRKLDRNNDNDYIYGSYCTYRISCYVPNGYDESGVNPESYNRYITYLAVYESSNVPNGVIAGVNEFSKKLVYYHNTLQEPIVLDHREYVLDGNEPAPMSTIPTLKPYTANGYKLNPSKNILNGTSQYYYVVARPSGPFLDTSDKGITKEVEEQLKKRHTSFITRYEAIGLDTSIFYSNTNNPRTAQPLCTSDYKLDSAIVSVLVNPSNVIFNDAYLEKDGYLYVSSITLHFRGNTKSLQNKIKISSNDNTRSVTFDLNDTGLVSSGEDISRTSYKISLNTSNSIAYIGYSEKANSAPTKLGMTCNICGSHQMVRNNSGNCTCQSYIEHLNSNDAAINSQWTLLKLSGAFKIQMSGRNTYSYSFDNASDIILEAVDVEITDSTSLKVGIKYTTPEKQTVNFTSPSNYIENLYNGTSQYIMKENTDYTDYNAKCVFFNSLCGTKMLNNENYYNDASTLFNDWESTVDKNKKISVYANELNYPVITVGGYGNALDSSKYVGSAYNKAIVSNAQFVDENDQIVPTKNDNNSIRVEDPDVYKNISNDTTDTSTNNLGISFSTSNTLRYSLPKPDVKLALDYKSAKFNGASAWTFTRSVPLNAASAANPHILIYKVEAWVETEDASGNLIIDKKASAAINTSAINGDNAHKVFSGRTPDTNKSKENNKELYGIDYAVENNEVLNNLYLKYNDNETYIYNAVSTSLPIKLLEPVTLSLGDNNTPIEIGNFYGGNALNYTIEEVEYNGNDEQNIKNIYDKIKEKITNNIQICLCSCCRPFDSSDNNLDNIDIDYMNDGVALTKDGKKVIYFGIGFYNSSDLIMPIAASFGIDLTFKDKSTGNYGKYPKRISLNEFFPKDSILYMSGKNHKDSTTSDENSKIRFVKSKNALNDDGLKIYDREGNQQSEGALEGEAVNIGGGIQTSTNHNEGEIHAASIEMSTNSENISALYGIFNIYSGEVNYISTGSSKIVKAGIPDVLESSENEQDTNGAYSKYVNFMNEISGKCLTGSQHICKFIHCTDNDENGGIPYIL